MDRSSCSANDNLRKRLAAGVFGCVVMLILVGCAGNAPLSSAPSALRGEGAPVAFSYPTSDGKIKGTADVLGRETVLLYLTTYDAVSLAACRRLLDIWHSREPRINVLFIVLEPPQNAPLVAVFRDSLGGDVPVVLADQETLEGRGALGDMRAVPGVVLLDRDGRVIFRGFGAEAYRHVEETLNDTAQR